MGMNRASKINRLPQVEFDALTHTYLVGGIRKPSVTEVLGKVGARVTIPADEENPERTFWRSFFDYSFLAESDADIAKARGRWVADLIAWRLKQKPWRLGEVLMPIITSVRRDRLEQTECYYGIIGSAWLPYYDCFERWWSGRRDLKTIFVEKPLYDPAMDCCGTLDWFGTMDGKYTIIDWKTGIASEDTRYQTAAYEMLIRSSKLAARISPSNYIRRAALELHNDGSDAKLIMYPIGDAANDRGVFLAARRIFQVQAEGLR